VESFPLWAEDSTMPKSKPPYPPDFRARVIDLVRSGRTIGSLSREFNVSQQSIRIWVKQSDLDAGRRQDGLTTDERQELARLKKDNARLREERDILEKAAAWFAREAGARSKKRSDS
jgi:transposase-like protein